MAIDRGVFVTPRVDVTTMKAYKSAAAGELSELIEVLTKHGRFKRAEFLAWDSITAIRQKTSVREIEIETDDKVISVSVPDAERLEKLGQALALLSSASTP